MKWKIISWNVNGIRAVYKKGEIVDFVNKEKPHVLCLSEIKLSCPFIEIQQNLKQDIKGYKYRYYSPSLARKGYAGTITFSKKKPLNVIYGIENEELDQEGRVITLEFKDFYVVNVYTPNSGQGLKRLKYRTEKWDPMFRKFIKKLDNKKPVIIAGDLNVAHREIDLHNPKSNKKSAGFTIEERKTFDELLNKNKLIDTFRHLYPDKTDIYSYWTYLRKSRSKNKGWRIDYFLLSQRALKWLKQSDIMTQKMGSDHAPILLKLNL